MSNLIPFGGNGALANPSKLASALQNVARESAPNGLFLRMGKDGVWIIGIEMEPVEDGAEFAVNPAGFGHGWIAWGKAERLGESFVPLTDIVPAPGALPDGARGWEQQFGMHLRDFDTQADLVFRSSSVGGKRAIGALAKEVGARLADGADKNVAIITLDNDSYKHKEFGKIYVPVFTIERWVTTDSISNQAPAAAAKAGNKAPPKAQKPKAKPATRARR